MNINLFFTPNSVDELFFTDKVAVAIDVLRATTSIITAVENGAHEIIPVATIEYAMKVSNNLFSGRTLLAGERNTQKIDGFNLGNSPFEFSKETIGGKSIVMYTTNGTKAIAKTKFGEQTFICSFMNIDACAEAIAAYGKDIHIVCSGRNNLFSIEDTVCSGMLIDAIMEKSPGVTLTDAAKAASLLAGQYKNSIHEMMQSSEHGRILAENGFAGDIAYCAQLNTSSAVPVFITNIIKGNRAG